MANKLTAQISIKINAPVSKVWNALTDAASVKKFMFGTDIETDWKKGSSITYSGEWQGKKYRDTGSIIDIQPGRLLHTTHYSNLSGKEDKPENYNHVIYELQPIEGATVLTLTQDNIDSETELEHSEQNWSMMLEQLKKLVEG